MNDIVKIINRKGNEYEVTRERAEKMVKNGDIDHKDIYEINVPPVRTTGPVLTLDTVAPLLAGTAPAIEAPLTVSTQEVVSKKETAKEPTIEQVLRAEYKHKYGKGVPLNRMKDVEWMKEMISANSVK